MKHLRPLFPCLLASVFLFLPAPVRAEEPKNRDFDVIRDEAAVPPYQLPPILVTAEDKAVTTAEEWFNLRRPQLMALFGNLIYGVVPQPESQEDELRRGEDRSRLHGRKGDAEGCADPVPEREGIG